MPDAFDLPADVGEKVHRVTYDMTQDEALQTAVNAVIKAAPAIWLYYCYNAEYLFYPFCETRSVGEMIATTQAFSLKAELQKGEFDDGHAH